MPPRLWVLDVVVGVVIGTVIEVSVVGSVIWVPLAAVVFEEIGPGANVLYVQPAISIVRPVSTYSLPFL